MCRLNVPLHSYGGNNMNVRKKIKLYYSRSLLPNVIKVLYNCIAM